VVLLDLVPADQHQPDLFAADTDQRQKLSPLIDRINDRYGRCSILWTVSARRARLQGSRVGRGNRTIRYNIKATRPPPLVPRSRAFEVGGRSYYDGTIARAADPAAVAPSIEKRGAGARDKCLAKYDYD
jgi:hypothetical protein